MRNFVIIVTILLFHDVVADNIDPAIPCSATADCTAYARTLQDAFCKDGFCACTNGTQVSNCSSVEHMHRGTGPHIFRPCKVDQDCPVQNGFCNKTISQCECQKDYVTSSNKQQCLEKASSIDFPCVDNKQCLAYLPNTTCDLGKCICTSGYHYVDNSCYKTVGLGGICKISQECSQIDGAACTANSVCGCPAETIINMDGKRCLPVARKIFEECTEDVQCSTTFSDSACIDKKCQCRSEFHYETDMSRCFISKGLDEDCGNSYECYQVEYASEDVDGKVVQCVSNKCVCAENYTLEDGRCVNSGKRRGEYVRTNAANSLEFAMQFLLISAAICFINASWLRI